jgi:hypothetical protein
VNFNVAGIIDQVVSRQLPAAVARVLSQVRSYGICNEKGGTGPDFLRVLQFLLPDLISSNAPYFSMLRGDS